MKSVERAFLALALRWTFSRWPERGLEFSFEADEGNVECLRRGCGHLVYMKQKHGGTRFAHSLVECKGTNMDLASSVGQTSSGKVFSTSLYSEDFLTKSGL